MSRLIHYSFKKPIFFLTRVYEVPSGHFNLILVTYLFKQNYFIYKQYKFKVEYVSKGVLRVKILQRVYVIFFLTND